MFVLGHLGFGTTIVRPWSDRLSRWALFGGMLLPDVIDKPLYYAHFSDIISCTRTFGHTGVLIALVLLVGVLTGRRVLVALAVGMATHVVLDLVSDLISGDRASSAWRAATWPFMGADFTEIDRMSIATHLWHLVNLQVVVAEIFGAALLWWSVRRTRADGTGSAT